METIIWGHYGTEHKIRLYPPLGRVFYTQTLNLTGFSYLLKHYSTGFGDFGEARECLKNDIGNDSGFSLHEHFLGDS